MKNTRSTRYETVCSRDRYVGIVIVRRGRAVSEGGAAQGNVGTAKNFRRNAKNSHDFCKKQYKTFWPEIHVAYHSSTESSTNSSTYLTYY